MVHCSFLFGKRTKAYHFTCEQTGGNLREHSNDVVMRTTEKINLRFHYVSTKSKQQEKQKGWNMQARDVII